MTSRARAEPAPAPAPTERSMVASDPVLSISDLGLRFGGVCALEEVSLEVRRGEVFAVIGPNGAGKTSLLNSISGLYRPQQGTITYRSTRSDDGPTELIGRRPDRIARLGIARSFQNIELFQHMTVLENLMLGRHVHMRGGVLSCALFWGRQQREEVEHRLAVEQVIDFLEIEKLRSKPVGTLAYGLQKRVELARALALDPELLLLDEPMAGMNVEEKEDIARFVLDINEDWGVTVVLIEHDMGVVMDLSDRIAVLDFGRRLATGTPEEIARDPAVMRAYLGGAEGDSQEARDDSRKLSEGDA